MINSHYLAPLFEPGCVAVIGATERKDAIGAVLMENMLSARYSGALYAVNPKYSQVRGVKCYASIADVRQAVDLAVIATPPATVPAIIEECGRAGTRSAVVITAGFSEVGPEGAVLERALLENARRYGLRLLGPNCLGLMRPDIGLNATFAHGNAVAGSLSVVSQSGAICTALLDWARPNKVGFSSVVSLGSSADLDFGEIVDYLTYDPKTEQILLYIEGIRNARRFVSALRAAARTKPVIVMKSGRHPTGVRAAVSHTGALVGADDVFEAAIRRTGAVRVTTVGQLVAAAQALSSHVRPRGDRLAVITNGGGPGVLAADRATDLGVPLAELSSHTIDVLAQVLPVNWSHGNPIDRIGDADARRYEAAVSACLADSNVDGILAMLTPQAMTSPTDAAHAVVRSAKGSTKPLLAAWMGEEQVIEGRRVFQAAQIPVFRTPEPAVEMFAHVSSFYRNQRMLMQAPGPLSRQTPPDVEAARALVASVLADHRTVFSSAESKSLLAMFNIPVGRTVAASSAAEAVGAARELGFPVAVKIDSPDITHKTDVGGVRLDLPDAEAVAAAYDGIIAAAQQRRPDAHISGVTVERMVKRANARELMIGIMTDKVFGPAVTFAAGGTAVEVLQDRTVGLPPLNRFLTEEMIRETRISRMLGTFRNMPPADVNGIASVLLRVSEMACELPWLRELDINPLFADDTGVIAADARIVIAPHVPAAQPYAHMAIHPYPTELVSEWRAADGTSATIRPIRPEDATIESDFVQSLSPQAKYLRFMAAVKDLTPAMLARFTQVDYDREMALIAVLDDAGRERQIGVTRYIINPDGQSCEFAIVVSEAWQGRGLGRHLMLQLIAVARTRGLKTMLGQVLAVNTHMLALAAALGFFIRDTPGDLSVKEVGFELRKGAV
ncbi:MAG: bifunctional acetate--CoA ligase family protein/GNAT family N-acetyltransferase [Burkholderiales bacterium]